MKVADLTGMSGAGKSLAADALEDMGYFCIDNMPVEFLLKFVELSTQTKSNIANIAVVTDIRSKSDLAGDFFITSNSCQVKAVSIKSSF